MHVASQVGLRLAGRLLGKGTVSPPDCTQIDAVSAAHYPHLGAWFSVPSLDPCFELYWLRNIQHETAESQATEGPELEEIWKLPRFCYSGRLPLSPMMIISDTFNSATKVHRDQAINHRARRHATIKRRLCLIYNTRCNNISDEPGSITDYSISNLPPFMRPLLMVNHSNFRQTLYTARLPFSNQIILKEHSKWA